MYFNRNVVKEKMTVKMERMMMKMTEKGRKRVIEGTKVFASVRTLW